MNRDEAKELLPVITAFANGEQIEFRTDEGWRLVSDPILYSYYEYRIKPKPKTCERWCFAVFYPDGSFGTHECATKDSAEELRAAILGHPGATFSPIVRVEFVEEKTA